MTNPAIVVLSDNPVLTADLPTRLEESYEFFLCQNMREAADRAINESAVGVIADLHGETTGGHADGLIVEELRSYLPEAAILMLTDVDCPEPLERSATSVGASHLRGLAGIDEILKWLTEKLPATVEATEHALRDEVDGERGKKKRTAVLHGITRQFETNTAQLKRMLADLEIAAQHDVTTLLIGETGSGKTFLSSLIHEVSPRHDEPFLPVACGALPSELIESELFGHVKGSFTSAHADKEGKFIAAGRGTILLDEIDVLGLEQQVKLLRVIETGEFEPVGSNQTFKSQARVIVASNLDLQPLVEHGRFRPDLYYRLNMLKFEIPPLRNRKPDITSLVDKFIAQFSRKHNIKIKRTEEGLYAALLNYPWPGNVRELENVIQRAVIYCREGVLTAEHLPAHVLLGMAGPTNDPSVTLTASAKTMNTNLNRQIATTEQEIIEQALFKNNYSRTNTAKELGISRVTLYNKMKKYNMSR